MDAQRAYADSVDRFVELLHGFVAASKHPHTTARSHMVATSPRDPGTSIVGEKLGTPKPVIVHDSRAVNQARKEFSTKSGATVGEVDRALTAEERADN